MNRYNPKEIEPKWQTIWRENGTFHVELDASKPKKYIIDMFPYPSGAAMHVGHVRNFTISDVLSQYHRQKGYNVMHAMGWDTFGLPAENYAIKTGTPPAETTKVNIANFKNQLTMLGMSYDWSREINTSDPEYYRWTQWVFTQLYAKGLAYQAERAQWWCETDKTVLANEQVENGKCWRCGNEVVKKKLNQWFFKITDYAEPLLEGIDDLDWPEKIKTMQRNWIGKSIGAEVTFAIEGHDHVVTVFTTRADTLFGATFLVLAPEHELVSDITTDEQREAVKAYVQQTAKKSEIERQENKEKTGVFTGAYATNPVTGENIPIWIADYVLTGYGTGAIMAVPAHDERDNDFARKFDLPIVEVLAEEFIYVDDNAPREGAETVERKVVDAIIKDENDNYLLLKEGSDVHFVGGGIDDDDEDELSALKREVAEESGYTSIKSIRKVTQQYRVEGYRKTKDINQFTYGCFYEVVVDRNVQTTSEVDDGKHEIEWVAKKEVGSRITWKHHAAAWQQYIDENDVFHGDGILINSGEYTGTESSQARERIVAWLAEQQAGHETTNYKMRDWLISRQRYWGAPIPIIHCPEHGAVAVPEDQLPVVLPVVKSYEPTGQGSVLATVTDWVNTTCPTCGGPAKRETDTMDGYACSSWYFLRYIDPTNDQRAWDIEKANYWLPVDYYCGGDHAVSHLLYTRFWFHFFADLGLIDKTRREPVGKLVYNGYILAPDGRKMSKSWGNTINPDDLISQGYGADSVRLFEMFIAPYDQNTNWNTTGVPGTFRFLQRFWNLAQEFLKQKPADDNVKADAVIKITHKTIKRVTSDLDDLSFNTAVAALMECVNELYRLKVSVGFGDRAAWQFALESVAQLLAPFAPHISEELWSQLGKTGSIHVANWPEFDETLLVEDTVTIAVQINGKVRSQVIVASGADQQTAVDSARQDTKVAGYLEGQEIVKTIYVPNKLISFVVRTNA